MKLPTTQARKLIDSANLSWIDKLVIGAMPKELAGNVDDTICQLTEWLNEPAGFANALFKRWTIGVEVQIFYKRDSGITTLDDEIKLAQLFVKNGWNVENSRDHIQDPDTRQVTKVFYFAKELIIKERES